LNCIDLVKFIVSESVFDELLNAKEGVFLIGLLNRLDNTFKSEHL